MKIQVSKTATGKLPDSFGHSRVSGSEDKLVKEYRTRQRIPAITGVDKAYNNKLFFEIFGHYPEEEDLL